MVKMRVKENTIGFSKDYINQIVDVEFFGRSFAGVKSHDVFITKNGTSFWGEELEPVEDIDDSNKIESLDKSARPTEEPSTESRPRTSKDTHDTAMKAIKNDMVELIKDMDVRMLTEEEIKEKVFKDIIPDTKVSIPEGSHVGKVFTSTHDVVNRPDHYHFSEFEPIKVIQAWDLSFTLGNVVKYIARAGRKDSSKLIEDLEKAKKYLEFEIEYLRNK